MSRSECCIHCRMAISLAGLEGEEVSTATVEDKFVEFGGNRSSCLPNDHSQRADGLPWDDPCPKHLDEYLPNISGVNCKVHCCHTSLNLFYSYRTKKGEKPGRYKVASTLYFCNGDPVSSSIPPIKSAGNKTESAGAEQTCSDEHMVYCVKCGSKLLPTRLKLSSLECPNACVREAKFCSFCGLNLIHTPEQGAQSSSFSNPQSHLD